MSHLLVAVVRMSGMADTSSEANGDAALVFGIKILTGAS